MAFRVEASDVLELVPSKLTTETITETMIAMANDFVNTHLANAGMTAVSLRFVELFLASHFVAIVEERGGILEAEFAGARELYSDIYESGLRSTRFGQQAIFFDASGTLARLGTAKQKAEFRIV